MATVSKSKDAILKKIRQALSKSVPLPFPGSETSEELFHANIEDDAIVFAEEFTKLQGKFAFCTDEKDLQQQFLLLVQQKGWKNIYCRDEKFLQLFGLPPGDDLAGCDVSVTGCEYLVARTGSIVLSSAQQSGRTTSVYAPVHICVAYNSQLLFDVKDALVFLRQKYPGNFPSFVTLASGPSRTADIEKTLVTGVHGPK